MKKTFILICLALGVAFSSFAQDRTEKVKALFKEMNTDEMIDQMMNNMMKVMKQQMASQFKEEGQAEKFNEFSDFLTEETKTLTKKLVNEVMVDLYAKHFTDQEIKELTDFYRTSTGKKLLTETPALTSEMMTILMKEYMPEFQQKLQTKMQEIKDK